MESGKLTPENGDVSGMSVAEAKETRQRIRSLERMLGRKTEEVEILREAIKIAREKTHLARILARNHRFRLKRIAEDLQVARSNLCEQLKEGKKVEHPLSAKPKVVAGADEVKAILRDRPTYGYRRVTAVLRKQTGLPINLKRIYRTMKRHNLLLQSSPRRPTRTHTGKVITLESNMRWCLDCFGIQCENGEQFQVAFSLNTHDREIISWIASSRGITGRMIADLIATSVAYRFGTSATRPPARIQWLTDNGPCYVARETVAFIKSMGFEVCTTPPYSPQSNGVAEALVKTIKRDYAHVTYLASAAAGMALLPTWFEGYNDHAAHKALRLLAPREYIKIRKQAA